MVAESGLPSKCRIALALSGGGVRAAAFHAGALKWMAENRWLERVSELSTVSGGSLLAGLLFTQSDNQWPSSEGYLSSGYERIRETIATTSLELDAVLRLVNPCNWRYILSRANILSLSIQNKWEIKARLKDLPLNPVWSINGTTAENGRRFRIKSGSIGDYEIGYANAGEMLLADALAISAAFPGGIGPLALDPSRYKWEKKKTWGSLDEAIPTKPPYRRLHIYDGGLYDNLGMEPLFDVGRQNIKPKVLAEFIIISDAGAPFRRAKIPGPFRIGRFLRILDVVMDQARALRVRPFIQYIRENPTHGRYYKIGDNLRLLIDAGMLPNNNSIFNECILNAEQIAFAKNYSTRLKAMGYKSFDLIALHGYETAKWKNEMQNYIKGATEKAGFNIFNNLEG